MRITFSSIKLGKTAASKAVVLDKSHIDDAKICVYVTSSTYLGQWNRLLKCMDGFGLYKYPDGTKYRGFFKNGAFHGYGNIKLASPYTLEITGIFDNGSLVSIDEMKFKDGTNFSAEFSAGGVDLSNWKHLKYSYKQTCREILQRNVNENFKKCKASVLQDCKMNKREFNQHYFGDLCAESKPLAAADEQRSIDSSRATVNDSFSTETILDRRMLHHCADLMPSNYKINFAENDDSMSLFD